MAVSDLSPLDTGTVPVVPDDGLRRSAVLIPLLPLGLVFGVMAAAMSGPPNTVRWAIAAVSGVAFYFGLEATGARIWGPEFDAGFWLAVFWR